jgi:CRISPR-associated protein Cmr6
VTYVVPTETKAVLGDDYPLRCDNMGLILDRYLPLEAIRNGRDDMIFNQNGRPIKTLRADWLQKVTQAVSGERLQPLQQALIERWQLSVQGALIFEMRARTRLIVGLGGKGALEFGITLHHTTGLPIIPGSALKGAARSYALWSIAAEQFANAKPEDWQTKETLDAFDKQLLTQGQVEHADADYYRRAFGSQEVGGACVFHDALVSRLQAGSIFAVDVMTPHYKDYYTSGGTKVPHDGDAPNPVSFLTVKEGTYFGFAVGLRYGTEDAALMRRAAQWLALALDELGIGSKTAAGYGAFKLVE